MDLSASQLAELRVPMTIDNWAVNFKEAPTQTDRNDWN